MDITNINALTRHRSYPAPRAAVTSVSRRDATPVARGQQQPAEQVLQGELLQKRRNSSSYDTTDLLDTMRAMDRVLRDTAATGSDAAPSRDARRAIATYTQQSIIPNTPVGSAAVSTIDYFA